MVDSYEIQLAKCAKIKEQLKNELNKIEKDIYDKETLYFENYHAVGNIIRGWEGYLTKQNRQNYSFNAKKLKLNPDDRIFKLSSAAGKKKIEEFKNDLEIVPQKSNINEKEPKENPRKMKLKRKHQKNHDYANFEEYNLI